MHANTRAALGLDADEFAAAEKISFPKIDS